LKNKGINIQIPKKCLRQANSIVMDIESGKSAIITAEEIENNNKKPQMTDKNPRLRRFIILCSIRI
jgi:hypothetical protein